MAPRPPNETGIDPRKQCAGDWHFLYGMATEFLADAISMVEKSISENADVIKGVSYRIKCTAETISMGRIAHAAYAVEVAVFEGASDTDLMSAQSTLLEKMLNLKILLSESCGAPALALVEGHFDDLSIENDSAGCPPRRTGSTASIHRVSAGRTRMRVSIENDDSSMRMLLVRWLSPYFEVVVVGEESDATVVVDTLVCGFDAETRCRIPTVVIGDLDEKLYASIHRVHHAWCDTVRSPPCAEELVRRLFGLVQQTFIPEPSKDPVD